jgi:hypothetical protein
MAESLSSGSVAFVTLTLRDGDDGSYPSLDYSRVQLMLKAFRMELFRKHGGNTLRFFCTGEFGSKKGRPHWHLIFLFKKPCLMRRMEKNELWRHWPDGWMSVENLCGERVIQQIRYCVKYVSKQVGHGDVPRVRCSANLGVQWLVARARETARNGLLLCPQYHIPGVVWGAGPRINQHVVYWAVGAMRTHAITAWRDEWETTFGDLAPMPQSDWLRRYDPDYIQRADPREHQQLSQLTTAVVREPAAFGKWNVVERTGYRCAGGKRWIAGKSERGAWGFYLHVDSWGNLGWYRNNPMKRTPIPGTVTEFLDVNTDAVCSMNDLREADAWVAAVRGDEWRPGIEQEEKAKRKQERADRAAFVQRHNDSAAQKLRAKHGTIANGKGVYARNQARRLEWAAYDLARCDCGSCAEARARTIETAKAQAFADRGSSERGSGSEAA